MKKLIFLLLPSISFAGALPPAPFPVFLKMGFSTVLDFDEAPAKVVLGDSQKFQVERLNDSLVIKTLTPFATTNMFVYFKEKETKLIILTASEDAQPTYYKKFDPPIQAPKAIPVPVAHVPAPATQRGGKVVLAHFDAKKDYLTVEFYLGNDSKELMKPTWAYVRLVYKNATLAPYKLWAERQDVQKDSRVKARAIFAKPNIPRNLQDVSLVVPIQGSLSPISLTLVGDKR